MAMRKNGRNTPKMFFLVFVVAFIIALLVGINLPILYEFKVIIVLVGTLFLALGGVYIYSRIAKK